VGHSQPCIIGTDNDAIIGTLSDGQQPADGTPLSGLRNPSFSQAVSKRFYP
jgi:hypothetical protein